LVRRSTRQETLTCSVNQSVGLPRLLRAASYSDQYGIYDVTDNAGWINLGMSHDTTTFALESIRRWWYELGAACYPTATRLLINADCGGSNGARLRLWKRELQALANELGITICMSHLPPGTSKWNKIEHRMFAFITQNWRGKPLVNYQVIVQLIANTSTKTRLMIACRLDTNAYEKGVKVSDKERDALQHPTRRFSWGLELARECRVLGYFLAARDVRW
jgi:hypothetical protein